MSFEGTRQDGTEPLQEEATATAQMDVYKQQWQRSRQAVLQGEDTKEASTSEAESIQGDIQAKDGPREETSSKECGNVSNPVLSGKEPDNEGMYNRFSCFAVHSKMAQSTNAKSKPGQGLYTDTDPDNRSEIITDVTIRVTGKSGTMMMEVKVDPGVQPSCIPLHKFQTLFPHLCRDGLPIPGMLDNTQSELQSYNGADMTCYGYLPIDVKNKVTKSIIPLDST